MKKHLTKAIHAILFIVATVPCLAQQKSTISFSYDANGNRTSRTLGTKRVSDNNGPNKDFSAFTESKNVEDDKSNFLSFAADTFASMEIDLYPNPTQDMLHLIVKNVKGDMTLLAVLTNATGSFLYNKTIDSLNDVIDLSLYPPGFYFLHLSSGGECHTWKIVKY